VINSFADEEARRIFDGARSRRYAAIRNVIERKLRMLHRARTLDDLRNPPGNRLEGLKGDRASQHSIRVNDQFRVCFEWRDGNAFEVEIVDYH
jgi:proteic killer suppression protein